MPIVLVLDSSIGSEKKYENKLASLKLKLVVSEDTRDTSLTKNVCLGNLSREEGGDGDVQWQNG